MPSVADISRFLNEFAPLGTAASWDNVGLIVGRADSFVSKLMTCLTVTPDVVAEAIESRVQLIVTHHPMLFRAVQRITDASVEGRMLIALIGAGIGVYSPHTAFDNCAGGINDLLAQRLGLTSITPLRTREGTARCKVVVFVPESDLGRVSEAMFSAGAGQIGAYSECSFRLPGIGTFFGSDASNPTIGAKGRREEVSELRLESICAESNVEAVIAAIRKSHSYEEPAYDVYPLRPGNDVSGDGRVGQLPNAVVLADWAARVRAALNCGPVQVVGEASRPIGRVAIACGAAGEYLNDAVRSGADVFITGELRFHDYLSAQARGIALILPGHYATERFAVESLAERLSSVFPDVAAHASVRERDPVTWF